jgi:thiamine-phosphate pyrophosphorylase
MSQGAAMIRSEVTVQRIPKLLAISDRRTLRAPENASASDLGVFFPKQEEFTSWFKCLARHGVDSVQLREKDLSDDNLLRLADLAMRLLPEAAVIINGRADIAMACGSRAVHLPADGIPTSSLRRRFGEDFLIGRSTHHLSEIIQAKEEGANYVTFSPIFPTPSKATFGPPSGLHGLLEATAVELPVLALGGLNPERIDEVAAVGAAGIAGIRTFQDPQQLTHLVEARNRLWPTE